MEGFTNAALDLSDVHSDLADGGVHGVEGFHPDVIHPGYVGDPIRHQSHGPVFKLHICHDRGVDHLVQRLRLPLRLLLKLNDVAQSIHRGAHAVHIVARKLPTGEYAGKFVEAFHAQDLAGGRASLPVAFAVLELLGDIAIVKIWLNHVDDSNVVMGAAAALPGVVLNLLRAVFESELFDQLVDLVRDLAGKGVGAEGVGLAEVELAEGGVVAADDGVVVFVDEHRSGAEDDEIEVKNGKGVVEIGLRHDKHHPPPDFVKPNTGGAGNVIFEVGDAETEPGTGRGGDPVHHAGGEGAGGEGASPVEDVGVLRVADTALKVGLEPHVTAREVKVSKLPPQRPVRVPGCLHGLKDRDFLLKLIDWDLHHQNSRWPYESRIIRSTSCSGVGLREEAAARRCARFMGVMSESFGTGFSFLPHNGHHWAVSIPSLMNRSKSAPASGPDQ